MADWPLDGAKSGGGDGLTYLGVLGVPDIGHGEGVLLARHHLLPPGAELRGRGLEGRLGGGQGQGTGWGQAVN